MYTKCFSKSSVKWLLIQKGFYLLCKNENYLLINLSKKMTGLKS
jgi:hypothetical protein